MSNLTSKQNMNLITDSTPVCIQYVDWSTMCELRCNSIKMHGSKSFAVINP